MNRYQVTYYYLATGMEGVADIKDYGVFEAKSAADAIDIVARLYGGTYKEWFKGCLTAKKV